MEYLELGQFSSFLRTENKKRAGRGNTFQPRTNMQTEFIGDESRNIPRARDQTDTKSYIELTVRVRGGRFSGKLGNLQQC